MFLSSLVRKYLLDRLQWDKSRDYVSGMYLASKKTEKIDQLSLHLLSGSKELINNMAKNRAKEGHWFAFVIKSTQLYVEVSEWCIMQQRETTCELHNPCLCIWLPFGTGAWTSDVHKNWTWCRIDLFCLKLWVFFPFCCWEYWYESISKLQEIDQHFEKLRMCVQYTLFMRRPL